MTTVEPIVRMDDVSAGYRRHAVLSGIHLSIAAGETLCLLGPNGGGKTTLFKTLLGLQPPLSGEVRVLGRPIAAWSREQFARQVGYVPQAHDGLFAFTVTDIVLMGRAARVGRFATPSRLDREVVLHCLDTLGIAGLAERAYTALSGGERQLALIARALAQEPALLVMDEPTASLDFGNQIRVLEHIDRLREGGIAILMSTHQPEHALRCADRIALLAQGRIVAMGTPIATATTANLAQLYGVPESMIGTHLPQLGSLQN